MALEQGSIRVNSRSRDAFRTFSHDVERRYISGGVASGSAIHTGDLPTCGKIIISSCVRATRVRNAMRW